MEDTWHFEQLHPKKLQLSISEKVGLKNAGAKFIYLVNDETDELISETYCIEVNTMLDSFEGDEIPPGVGEWRDGSAIYCYSNTTLEKYQRGGFGKTLKAYFLGYAKAKGFEFSIGHARRPGSIKLNQNFGAEIICDYADYYETGETYDFYKQKL